MPSRPRLVTPVAEESAGAWAPIGFGLPVQLTTSIPRWMSSTAPLGVRGLLWAQLGVLLAGHLSGAVVLSQGVRRRARRPAAVALAVLAAASVIALASH